MSSQVYIPSALRIGEVVALALGFGLSTFAVFARLYTQKCLTKSIKIEDYVSMVAWLGYLAFMGLGIAIGRNGGTVVQIAYLSEVEVILYNPIIALVKTAIMLQYITIFIPQKRGMTYFVIIFLLWINIIYYTVATLSIIFRCSPRAKAWDTDLSGRCLSGHKIQLTNCILNVLSDFLILALPLPLIWSLKLNRRRKLSVMAVFGVGSFACIASIVRLTYIVQLLHIPQGSSGYTLDIDRIGVWSFAEIAVGIIVGCLPVLPRFFKNFHSKLSNSISRRTTTGSSGNRTKYSWCRLLANFRTRSNGLRPSTSWASYDRSRNNSNPKAPYTSTLQPHSNFSPTLNDGFRSFHASTITKPSRSYLGRTRYDEQSLKAEGHNDIEAYPLETPAERNEINRQTESHSIPSNRAG